MNRVAWAAGLSFGGSLAELQKELSVGSLWSMVGHSLQFVLLNSSLVGSWIFSDAPRHPKVKKAQVEEGERCLSSA